MGIWGGPHAPVTLSLAAGYVAEHNILDLGRWLRYDSQKYLMVEEKLGTAGAPGPIFDKGMLDVGDAVSADRSCCHNNENDAILQLFREYYRRGAPAHLYFALLKARHNAHVDFVAWDPDDSFRDGTMPAHCPEHTDGAAYPSHMWVEGLLTAYCVSGETDFRDAALSVGENMRRWQTDRPGLFYCDSRECGWPMLAYLRLFRHTGRQEWLDAAGEVFEFYRTHVNEQAELLYAIPHGVGTTLAGYGEFITWRACFFYWEISGHEEVRDFLLRCLTRESVYRLTPERLARGGWACNDLFPAWAAWKLTGDTRYLHENHAFFRLLMKRPEKFPWGGVDMHYFLNALDQLNELETFL